MKKFVSMFTLILLVGCNQDNNVVDIEIPSMWDEIEMKMEATDLSALEVLKSADYWQATKMYYYTLPNGEGEEHCLHDVELGIFASGGTPYVEGRAVTSDNVWREYYSAHAYKLYGVDDCEHILPRHHIDWELEISDGTITAIKKDGKTYSFKVIAYDEKSVLIESNYWGSINRPYGRFLLERQVAESPDWEKQYDVDGDEWRKNHEETCEGWQEYINQYAK